MVKGVVFGVLVLCFLQTGLVNAQILGCTDNQATNFNPQATQNDGSCLYPNTTVSPIESWNLPQELVETSGLAQWDGGIWTHNDNAETILYQIDTTGGNVTTSSISLTGVVNHDWEEIKADSLYIYLADVGNNASGNRTDLHILRILRTTLTSGSPQIDTIGFSYANQTSFSASAPNATDFDCEAIIVENDSIFLFTKEWTSNMTTLYVIPNEPGNHVAYVRGTWDVQGLVTGAAYLEDKKLVLLVAYTETLMPFFVLLYDFSGNDFFAGNKRKIVMNLPFHQVEGITTIDGTYVLVSNEKFQQSILTVDQKLHSFDFSTFLSEYLNPSSAALIDVPQQEIRVSPNPASKTIQLECSPSTIGKIMQLLDTNGSIVWRGIIEEEFFMIPAENLEEGNYFLQVVGESLQLKVQLLHAD
jgi:hypothetical protein